MEHPLIAKLSDFGGGLNVQIPDSSRIENVKIRPATSNLTLSSSNVNKVLNPELSIIGNDAVYVGRPYESNPNLKDTTGIIGGQTPSIDRWKDIRDTLKNKKNSSSVRRMNNLPITDPITGKELTYISNNNTNTATKYSITSRSHHNEYQDEEIPLVTKLRADLVARGGGTGIANLGRKFRIIDDDGSKTLSSSEFTKALRETALGLKDDEIKQLFAIFGR